ncbi:hypothetical protein QT972_14775 [Microcoleus sp. herbarium7]|uniref:hypothetical protein n=1 Tax=Microcoleus sp. herbarium7 TaxID=3055435 RepID=UPI002FD1DD2F
MNFNSDFIYQFSDSTEPFPVELIKACDWLVFLDSCEMLKMVQSYFDEGVDYMLLDDTCFLTVACFQEFAMIAPTPQGKAVRRYYLECAKSVTGDRPPDPKPPEIIPVILPTEAQLHAMRTRESEKQELASLPPLTKKIHKYRRATDIARERALRAKEEEVIDW